MSSAKIFPLKGRRIFVAGHRGMVGSAIVRRLAQEECMVLTAGRDELDLRRQDHVERWMHRHRPDTVIVAAAKVGGILANRDAPADFIYDNLAIELNIIRSAHVINADKLLFLGSSCIYPRLADQPIREEALLTGPLEPTNEWYSIAKIAGLKLCQAFRAQYGADFISIMPTNLYGPGDNFDLNTAHVIPALIRKLHEAKRNRRDEVLIWGTGQPWREFLHVDDLADACVFVLEHYSGPCPLNVGSGEEITISELANMMARIIGFTGTFVFDSSKPDGTPRKWLDSSRIRELGWAPKIPLESGVTSTYRWYVKFCDDVPPEFGTG